MVRSFLASITYSIVIIAALLFGKIIVDGAPVLFKTEAPFVDFEFLTAKNETLHVFDDSLGNRHQLPASEYSDTSLSMRELRFIMSRLTPTRVVASQARLMAPHC